MRFIINTSNLFTGGGVQVALSFINECLKFTNHEFHVFLCDALKKQIKKEQFPDNFLFYDIDKKSNFLFNILFLKNKLSSIEKRIKPDAVFSIFGPSYWTPKTPHLLGFAIPHYLYPESPFFKIISKKECVIWYLRKFFHSFFFKMNASIYHIETEDARLRFSRFLDVNVNNIYTVSNTYSSYFDEDFSKSLKILPDKLEKEVRILLLSSYYKHKNLEILNEIVPLINSRMKNEQVKFVTTLPDEVFKNIFRLNVIDNIINIGPVESKRCPQLYNECDIVFLPTLLEVFSANYPEAMKMGKPIITTNLPFSKSICGDAALYFEPLDAIDAVEKIVCLIYNQSLQNQLIVNGKKQLEYFPSAECRALMYIEILNKIASK